MLLNTRSVKNKTQLVQILDEGADLACITKTLVSAEGSVALSLMCPPGYSIQYQGRLERWCGKTSHCLPQRPSSSLPWRILAWRHSTCHWGQGTSGSDVITSPQFWPLYTGNLYISVPASQDSWECKLWEIPVRGKMRNQAFLVVAPWLWNELPPAIHLASLPAIFFKKSLKT